MDAHEPPKLFISYSWTTPEHKQWVLELAKDLRKNGVDAQLDAWDITLGQDPIVFMEQMVIDDTIRKVLMVVDENYAEKANARQGGVGTEARIISKEMYENTGQEKFVALVLEKNDKGEPYLPEYCKTRMYIDFTELENIEEEFKKLLHWIFSIPEHEKPPIGSPPDFLFNRTSDDKSTLPSFMQRVEPIKTTRKHPVRQFGIRHPKTETCIGRSGDRWVIHPDRANEWRWLRTATNGRLVGASSEGYKNKSDCIANAKRHGMDCNPS